jgi:hypothetical protein
MTTYLMSLISARSILLESTLQRQNAENLKQIFPEKEYRGLSPNFHIHVSMSELYILTMGLPFLLEEICGPILGIYKSLTDTWNVENGAEAAQFPGKEYTIGISVAVYRERKIWPCLRAPCLQYPPPYIMPIIAKTKTYTVPVKYIAPRNVY